MTSSATVEDVAWDLSGLYKGLSDPQIAKDKSEIAALVRAFAGKYKGKVNTLLSANKLLAAIRRIEAINEKLYAYASYASYLHSTDTKSPAIGAFYQEAREFTSKTTADLLWFELEIQELSAQHTKKLLASGQLRDYKHYLSHVRVFSPFRKSLAEEEILVKKNQTGGGAFVRFYDQKSASETFVYKGKKLGYPEISAILKDDPVTNNRKLAAQAYTKTYKQNEDFYTYVLNTLLLDKKIDDEIRGYKFPQQATLLSYEIELSTVKALVKSVVQSYPLCERYYKAKSRVLSRKLYEWDRYSRLYASGKAQAISWDSAKEVVLSSFRAFDNEFASVAELFFSKNWIDARVMPAKRGGAFCSYCVPSKNPFVLMSYTGTVDDVMTLAHELGHGVHAYLSKGNSLYNYQSSTAVAEIASIFAESLVFERMYSNAVSDKEKLNLLANKIQGSMATIFRQIAFYEFELAIHTHRRERGELSVDDFNGYFQTHLKKMFGKGLALTEQHKYWWMPVLHFYHYNFYVFTYAFGEALTLALYQKYKMDKDGFVANYKKALKLGGSKSPREITKTMSVDINKPGFWQEGINLLEGYIAEFENLAK